MNGERAMLPPVCWALQGSRCWMIWYHLWYFSIEFSVVHYCCVFNVMITLTMRQLCAQCKHNQGRGRIRSGWQGSGLTTQKMTLALPFNLTACFCERKQEYPPASAWREPANSTQKGLEANLGLFIQWGSSANHCLTVTPYVFLCFC